MKLIKDYFDVAVIGGGPAGLAAALSAKREGKTVILIEREKRLGGILKQCIHDGFGLIRFGEKMSGPEYAQNFIDELLGKDIEVALLTYATKIEKINDSINITLVSSKGMRYVSVKSLVLSTGCRERTAKQISVHGTRPAGVYTAGTAQYLTNIFGILPTKRCVILGSGDIGLIMARRLTLEGASVLGVYEAKKTPSGLSRNISQCLHDFNIPLYTGKTVTKVFGDLRLEGVEISDVDDNMNVIENTNEYISCDSLILSVELIPENELAETLNIKLDIKTKGPIIDQNYMTSIDGVFVCGNALHVNDLVDYVSESGEEAGKSAANYMYENTHLVPIQSDNNFLYTVPQNIDLGSNHDKVVIFFRSKHELKKTLVSITVDGREIFKKKYKALRPPEMERIEIDFEKANITRESKIIMSIKEVT